jgi:hypothetical protein
MRMTRDLLAHTASSDADQMLRQLFLAADTHRAASPGDADFVRTVMADIEILEEKRSSRLRAAITWLVTGCGIGAGALLPLAVAPLQEAATRMPGLAAPDMALLTQGGPVTILVLGLAAMALLAFTTERA